MAPPTLLTLPREIRNHIYSYLSKELQCDWVAAINEDHTPTADSDECYDLATGPLLYDVVKVVFNNAPDPAVLAVHSCLRAEYLKEQELPSEGLSVCINLKLGTVYLSESNEQDTDARIKITFTKVKHVILNVDIQTYNIDHDSYTLPAFLEALLPKLTNVGTLRITLRQAYTPLPDMKLLHHLLPPGFAERAVGFLPVFPNVLAGLYAIQRSEGYRVGFASVMDAETHGFAAGNVNAHWNPDNLSFVTWHRIHKVGVYMYAKPGVDMAKLPFWTTSEVVEHFPVNEYPNEVFEGMAEGKIERLKGYSSELVQWFEEHETGEQ
jgi:hypothetical protein